MCRHSSMWIIALLAMLLIGCGNGDSEEMDEEARQQAVARFEQVLLLDADGQAVRIPLEKMDVFLVDPEAADRFPESFEFHGQGVVLVGSFPMNLRVDYGEHWNVLIGQAIPISAEGGERGRTRSSLSLPGGTPMPVSGGSFTVEKVGKGWDAKTPLNGKIRIEVQTESGTKTYEGTFAVKGTTWG